MGWRKKHLIAIYLTLITEPVCVVTLMRKWTGLCIFGMTTAQCISKATHIYVGSAVTKKIILIINKNKKYKAANGENFVTVNMLSLLVYDF